MKLLRFNEAKLQLGNIETEKYGKYNSIQWLNTKIYEYILEVYTPFGFEYNRPKVLNIEGKSIYSEYIGKMVNNYTIFKQIIRTNHITTEEGFYHFMLNNLDKYYHYNGEFFHSVTLDILYKTAKRGSIGEESSFKYFEQLLKNLNLDIKVEKPTMDEDIAGIDGKFIWNGKIITIQVKPFTTYTVDDNNMIKAYSPGSLSLGTDYLILYNNNNKFLVAKTKDVKIDGNYFVINKDNVK